MKLSNRSNRKMQSLTLACSIALLATLPSVAQQPSSQPEGSESHAPMPVSPNTTQSRPTTVAPPENQFTSMDKNRDMKISVEEYTGSTLAAFKSMDRNRDGKISGVELTEAQPAASGTPSPLSSAQIGEIDTDKDLQLTNKEASVGAVRLFRNLDINADGYLDDAELKGRQYRSDTEAGADSRSTSKNVGEKEPQPNK